MVGINDARRCALSHMTTAQDVGGHGEIAQAFRQVVQRLAVGMAGKNLGCPIRFR